MKQTAVEWLVSELKKYDSAGLKDQSNYVIEMPTHILTELEEEAKEMEKQQQGYSDEDMIRFANLYSDININESHLKYFNNLPKFKNK